MNTDAVVDAVGARQLRVLVALADEGTFTDAAIALRLSQPAVSRALARLEQTLGARLVDRTTRSLELTREGRAACAAAVTALRALEAVVHAAQGDARPVRLGYAWAAFGPYTNAILRGWRAEHPDVPLEIHRVDERWAGLTRGLVDIAIRRDEVHAPGIEVEPIFEEDRIAALPSGSALAERRSLTLADLAGERIALTPAFGSTTLELWPEDIRPARTVQVANTDEWLLAIASGEAAGVTAASTASQHPHPGVQYVPIEGAPRLTVSLLWMQDRPHPATAQFVALVHRCCATGPAAGPATVSAR